MPWIKWEIGLLDKPEVFRMSAALKTSREVVVCRLMKFWEWCDANIPESSIDESGSAFLEMSPESGDNMAFVDALVGSSGFASSLSSVGWIRFRHGRIELPNFGRHNGETAKTRARNAKNQQSKRLKGTPVTTAQTQMSPESGDISVTRGEERRKSKDASHPCDADAPPPDPPPKKPRKPPDTPHHRAIADFCARWHTKYGVKYPFASGKDGEAVRWLLAQVDGDEAVLSKVFERFLADHEDELALKARHSLGVLRASLAKWLVDPPKPHSPSGGTRGAIYDEVPR